MDRRPCRRQPSQYPRQRSCLQHPRLRRLCHRRPCQKPPSSRRSPHHHCSFPLIQGSSHFLEASTSKQKCSKRPASLRRTTERGLGNRAEVQPSPVVRRAAVVVFQLFCCLRTRPEILSVSAYEC